jgi:hypothetical protein
LGVGEDETDDWRESNMIPDSNDLQSNEEDSQESQRKKAASEVSSTSNTSVRGQPPGAPAPKVRRIDG